MVYLYTDGAARGNPGPGGYGALLRYGAHQKELSGAFRNTTNNRMELLAVIKGLEALTRPSLTVHIYSDSRYVVNAITKGWLPRWQATKFKGKKNADLWQRLIPLLQKHRTTFTWVQGHTGHPENERCDVLATTASRTGPWQEDHAYEALTAP